MADDKATGTTTAKVTKSGDSEAKLNAACATIRKIKSVLENVLGLDIDGDGKIGRTYLPLLLTIMLIGGTLFSAEVLRDGWGTGENFGTFAVYGDAATDTARIVIDTLTPTTLNATDANVADDLAVTDDASIGGKLTITPTALTVTNGQAVTVADSLYVVTGSGGADNTTNTITLAAPAATGDIVQLIVDNASSNLIGLADSGNLALTGAWVGDNNDSITLTGVIHSDTTNWVETSSTDN